MSRKRSKYIGAFDYTDKTVVVLSRTSGGISIISFASESGAPAGTASTSFTLVFSLATEIIKKVLERTKNKKKKHNKIFMVAKSNLNSIEALISEELIDLDISHENLKQLLTKKMNMKEWKKILNRWKVVMNYV